MVGSPIAGIDPNELYDTRALCQQIENWYTDNGKGKNHDYSSRSKVENGIENI